MPGVKEQLISDEDLDRLRREDLFEVNFKPQERPALEQRYGQVWDADEFERDFSVVGFLAPYVVVTRRADGAGGSLMFQHRPRYYFSWEADDP